MVNIEIDTLARYVARLNDLRRLKGPGLGGREDARRRAGGGVPRGVSHSRTPGDFTSKDGKIVACAIRCPAPISCRAADGELRPPAVGLWTSATGSASIAETDGIA